jgi:hypothetical protein
VVAASVAAKKYTSRPIVSINNFDDMLFRVLLIVGCIKKNNNYDRYLYARSV